MHSVKKAAEDAAQAHANYLARYLSPGFTRKAGVETLAIVAASAEGKLNQVVGSALARRLKTEANETATSFFKPELFLTDCLPRCLTVRPINLTNWNSRDLWT